MELNKILRNNKEAIIGIAIVTVYFIVVGLLNSLQQPQTSPTPSQVQIPEAVKIEGLYSFDPFFADLSIDVEDSNYTPLIGKTLNLKVSSQSEIAILGIEGKSPFRSFKDIPTSGTAIITGALDNENNFVPEKFIFSVIY